MSETLEQARARRSEAALERVIDRHLEILLANVDEGWEAKDGLRKLVKHYMSQDEPYRSCVRENMGRFGPGKTESVCATLKDIGRGTFNWNKGSGVYATTEGDFEISEELAKVLLEIPEADYDKFELALSSETYESSMHFADSPTAILDEQEIEEGTIAESPDAEANYREAEIQGVVCANCTHYERRDPGEDGEESSGVCQLWEAAVRGGHVCDRFTIDSRQVDETTGEVYDFSAELFNPGGEVEFADDDGFIVKEIMRTGEWGKTPGAKGVVRKPLQVVRDGKSSRDDRIISLSELVESFDNDAYQYVTVPLSDDEKDHKNLTRLNTGFIKKLFIEDLPSGVSKLKAKFDIRDAEVREKLKTGVIPDVSAGVHFDVERPDGKQFGSAVNHVCLTVKPFMDGLNPFGVAFSDDGTEEDDTDNGPKHIETFVPPETPEEESKWDDRASFSWQRERVEEALAVHLGDHSSEYTVSDIADNKAVITSDIADSSWVAEFERSEDGVILSAPENWEARSAEEAEEDESEESEQPDEPVAAPETNGGITFSDLTALEQARMLREVRSRGNDKNEGGVTMGHKIDEIDFSDPEKAKAAFEQQAQETQALRAKSRVGEVDAEIKRVKELGFADAPGFLATLRDILLSDDEEPAVVLLSHDEDGSETSGSRRETLTASDVAKRLIAALPVTDDGKVLLAQQHLQNGNEVKPEEDDNEPDVEARTRDAEKAIHGKVLSGSGEE